MADALGADDEHALDGAEAEAETRVKALAARRPGLVVSDLLGRPRCDDPRALATDGHDRRPLALVQDGDDAEMFLYGDIDSWGGWWGVSAEEFRAELEQCTAKNLTLHVNSYGGEVFEGLAIRTALMRCPANVTVTVDAIAASIASVIAMAGETVVMSDPSMLMIHDAWGFSVGSAAEMRKMADLLDKISDQLAGVYAGKAGGTLDVWREAMLAETWYSADEAVAAGLADRVDGAAMSDPGADDDSTMASIAERFHAAGLSQTAADLAARVMLGQSPRRAGPDAGTPAPDPEALLDVATPTHHTAVEDGTWDANANLSRVDWPASAEKAKALSCGYRDAMTDDDGKVPRGAVYLPHHFVDADGNVGAASIAGVNAAKARLSQTQGISEAERATAEAHLDAHQDDYADDGDAETEDHWADTVAHLTTQPVWDDLTEALTS